jgi:hypothetical protein
MMKLSPKLIVLIALAVAKIIRQGLNARYKTDQQTPENERIAVY